MFYIHLIQQKLLSFNQYIKYFKRLFKKNFNLSPYLKAYQDEDKIKSEKDSIDALATYEDKL